MVKFVPKQKLSKKAQKELNSVKRETWGSINPVTRRTENKKAYNRKKSLDRYGEYGRGFFYAVYRGLTPEIMG